MGADDRTGGCPGDGIGIATAPAVDLALFGCWPDRQEGARLADAAGIEQKSTEPAEALRLLLNDMTVEMRAQFELFRRLRDGAEPLARLGDDAEARQARADAKAAVDAMSVIIRTLEKIDQLQRQLAEERQAADEASGDEDDYEAHLARLLALLDQRAADGGGHGRASGDGPPAADREPGRTPAAGGAGAHGSKPARRLHAGAGDPDAAGG